MDLNILLVVAALHAVVLIVPGPDVLLVSQTALARTRRAALLAGLGVVLGISVWASLALLGIGLLFEAFPWVHGVIRVAGGLYLLWMGYSLWRSSARPDTQAAPVQGRPAKEFVTASPPSRPAPTGPPRPRPGGATPCNLARPCR